MPCELQPGANSIHREDRKDLKEFQLLLFAVFVILAVLFPHSIFSQLPGTDFPCAFKRLAGKPTPAN